MKGKQSKRQAQSETGHKMKSRLRIKGKQNKRETQNERSRGIKGRQSESG